MALTTQQKWAIGLLLTAGVGGLMWLLGDDDPESEQEYDLNDPEEYQQFLETVANDQEAAAAAAAQLGLISPLPQPYKATRPYGRVRAAFDPTETVFHYGVDMGAPQGTPVFAVADGVVSTSKAYLCSSDARPCPSPVKKPKCNCWNGYKSSGEGIWITHPQFGSKAYSGYLHLHQRYKQVGDEVKQGDLIGTVGNTGASTSPHLHFEVWLNNKAVDPAPHLPEHALDRARMAARLV